MEDKRHLTFRTYAPSDRQTCIDIFKSNIPEYFVEKELNDFVAWLDDQASLTLSESEYQQYLLVEHENKIVGCGGFHIDLAKRSARMTWGMIERNLHRKGLGTQFLLHRIRMIQAVCKPCTIALDTTQHAAPFFETVGFRTTLITEHFYAPGMHRYDMVL